MRSISFFVFIVSLALGHAAVAGERSEGADQRYRVVINHEEQYSIWLADRELPRGWEATDFIGTRDESLRHIEEVWTDMRPLANRRAAALEIYRNLSSSAKQAEAGGERYRVVINHEEQYSIWFADRELPKGWEATDFTGTREESLRHIEEVWTDMRPLANRRATALEIYKKLQRER